MTLQRHASLGNSRALIRKRQARTQAQMNLGRHSQSVRDVYLSDDPGGRAEGRFRWLVSTCLAGAVGILAIAVVISGSLKREKSAGFLDPFAIELQKSATQPFQFPKRRLRGLKWAVPKSERLQIATGVRSTKEILHESMRQRDGEREVMLIKPYAKLTSKLADLSPEESKTIPPFNPLKLYAASAKAVTAGGAAAGINKQATVRILNLNGANLPVEDGQELQDKQIAAVIAQLQNEQRGILIQASFSPTSAQYSDATVAEGANNIPADVIPPDTAVLYKNTFEQDAQEDLSTKEVKAIKVKRGDSLERLLLANGAEPWQANQMANAAAEVFPAKSLSPGQIIYLTLASSLTQPGNQEATGFSIFARGHRHKVTVTRDDAGDFKASSNPVGLGITQAVLSGKAPAQHSTLYASIFQAMRQQGLKDPTIMKVLRMYAYSTDFRKKVRPGDNINFFFDMRDDDKGADSPLGEMLLLSLTVGEETKKFYRFRSSDGRVDYYDKEGNNSKKFLTRKPVRSAQVRLSSGFGMRYHPIARRRKMHTGVDWAAPRGTPILAGGTGLVEQAGRKGGNGNYIRIRHANGYQTSYSHMKKFARGIRPGVKVRLGQLIGYVGNTGFSTGPHLHYEVIVNKRKIDPMKMRVPQERRLRGKDLLAFKRERARIDNLITRAPIARPGN